MRHLIYFSFLLLSNLLFTTAYASDCYRADITQPSPFMGNHGEVFKLDNGSYWEVQFEYEYLYEYYPTVVVCEGDDLIIINGKKISVRLISY